MRVSKKKPVPKKVGPGRKREKWRFDLLQAVDDSILIPGDPSVLIKTAYSALKSYNEFSGAKEIKITVRSEDKGLRIWRIK